MSEQDTREQLEADVMDFCEHFYTTERRYNKLMKLLDRQAAITANEMNHNNPYVGLVRGKQWERTEISDYYCGRCGWKVTDHDSYCPECGGALHKASNKPNSQFDVLKTAENAENATSKNEIRNLDDSREQLEADILAHYKTPEEKLLTVRKWLDRQATITAAGFDCNACADSVLQRESALCAKVDRIAADKTKLQAEIEKLEHDCELLFDEKRKLTDECDELKAEISKYEHDCGLLFDEKDKLTADAKKWADAANEQRLVAMEQAEKVQEITVERDELKAFAERLETASRAKLGVTLFGVDYVTEEFMLHVQDTLIAELTAERDEWKAKAESALHENPYVGLVRGKRWERTEISDYYCGRCGWKVTDHDSYCPECGGALHKASNKPDGKFDARKTAEMPETDATKAHMRDFDDTREQLEADAMCDAKMLWNSADECIIVIRSWLDRQAAITERETVKQWEEQASELVCHANKLQTQVDELTAERDELKAEVKSQRKRANDAERGVLSEEWYVCRDRYEDDIAELTAERDELQSAIDSMENGQFYAMYEELRAEVDNLRKRNDSQADTIGRLRAEFDAALDDLARAVEDKRSHPF